MVKIPFMFIDDPPLANEEISAIGSSRTGSELVSESANHLLYVLSPRLIEMVSAREAVHDAVLRGVAAVLAAANEYVGVDCFHRDLPINFRLDFGHDLVDCPRMSMSLVHGIVADPVMNGLQYISRKLPFRMLWPIFAGVR